MKKNDIWLIAIILVIGLGISLITYLQENNGPGQRVIVKSDGEIIHSYTLKEDGRHDVTTRYGYNIIVIKDENVYISEADCDGNDCIGMGSISKTGERIVCLPHRLEIYIEGDDQDVDTVAY